MDLIKPFLQDIHQNDNQEWLAANRDYYNQAFGRNAQYIKLLIELIGKFDSSVASLTLNQCSFNIERDQRIKIDDRKYNDFFSGSFTRGGKYSGYASYYYQISPEPSSSGGSFLAVGLYRPNKELLTYFKRTIVELGTQEFDAMIKRTGFKIYDKESVKRIPSNISVEKQYEHYFHMRDILLILPLEIEWFEQENWCEKTAKIFERCKPFIDFINSAVDNYRNSSALPVGHGLRPIKRVERSAILRNTDTTPTKHRRSYKLRIDDEFVNISKTIK